MTKRSRHSYQVTLSMLKERIAAGGNTIFAEIDQAAAAKEAGLHLRPTMLIVFGNPKGGTPIMDAFPLAALDLPLKLLVWEDGDGVAIAYVPMSEIAARYGVTAMEDRIAAIDAALERLTGAVV
ncbi:MAG TPA: DUF302 domain-containing protein [Candidatus Cybelea sp.]|nr:DUF302 domain-containing protein [Candidatus Cybelea sp.]